MMIMKIPVWILICTTLSASFCFADTLELTNGDTITGTIVSMDEEKVIVQTDYGLLQIRREYIKEGIFTSNGEGMSGQNMENNPIEGSGTEKPANPPVRGLIGEFLFNGNLLDTSGHSDILLNVNNTGFGKGADNSEKSAIEADGTGKYLFTSSLKEFDECHSFSISLWVYIRNSTKSQYLISKWASSSGEKAEGKVALNIKVPAIRCFVVDAEGYHHNLHVAEAIKQEQWQHIVVICDMGELRLYVDNKLYGKKQYSFTRLKKDNAPLYILTAKANNARTWSYYNCDGLIDSLRIYDRMLSEAEIAALYAEF
ncbi:MAG: LamG domain-containing protein [Spirochaetales bacterium]|nr:LamG domain-containing protein [Spirochaetales bacterium]